MEALPGFWSLTPIGALLGVLVLIFWLTTTGRYVPAKTVDAALAARDAAHAINLAQANKRGDEWKEVAEKRGETIDELTSQNSTLIEGNRTATAFFGTVDRGGGVNRVEETK